MTSVTYSSTRGGQKNLDFRTVVMTGLAHDRGLFVPDSMPSVTKEELESWRSLSYPDLAVQVISKFVKEDQVPAEKLSDIIKRSCAAFKHKDVTPVIKVGGHAVLVRMVWIARTRMVTTCLLLCLFVGAVPWTHFCIQRCRLTNARKLL